jgi:CarboxypepD_reg-like domain
MSTLFPKIYFLLVAIILSFSLRAQERFTISGYVKDAETGETIIGANVYLENDASRGTATNTYGFYSMTLPSNEYRLVFSYLGYQPHVETISLVANMNINVVLNQGVQMEEVVVSATEEEEDENVQSTSMGKVSLPIEQIKVLPALLGEAEAPTRI